jgi:hypothetical protein
MSFIAVDVQFLEKSILLVAETVPCEEGSRAGSSSRMLLAMPIPHVPVPNCLPVDVCGAVRAVKLELE